MKKAVLPALTLGVVLLTGCVPGGMVAASDTPAPVETVSSTPTPDATIPTAPEPGAVPDDARANIIDAMNSGNTAAIDGYLAPTVEVVLAASEYGGPVSDHAQIIDDLTGFTGDSITWDFDLPESLIENYRNNPGAGGSYTRFFTESSLVGKSSADGVVSFTFTGGVITTILLADEYSLIFE